MSLKNIGTLLITAGILIIGLSLLADIIIGLREEGEIGAAQLLGINFGLFLIFFGAGFHTITWTEKLNAKKISNTFIEKLLDLHPSFWIISSFLLLYLIFFISPVFFTKLKIQYFVKYIPYEWVNFIGNDIVWTVDHIRQWLLNGQSPYGGFFYPPLTTILFAPLIILGYPGYYKLIVIITLLCFIVSALLVPLFVSPSKQYHLVLFFFITGLFSYGLQFELDRGQFNLIAFTASILAIYIFHFHHKFRYYAYLLFSLSIQLKMYPIIFIVMFVRHWRDWTNNIKRIIGLVIFNFFLLFVLGYETFRNFVSNLAKAQLQFTSSRHEDLSIKGFVYNLTTDGFGIIPQEKLSELGQLSELIELAFLVLFGLCFLFVITQAYLQNKKGLNPFLLTICTIGALIIPSASVDYKLPMLIGPMAITLANLPNNSHRQKPVLIITIIVITSIAFWSTYYPFTVKPYVLSRNFPALIIILIAITGLSRIVPYTLGEKALENSFC